MITVLIRTLILYLLIVVGLRLMGKRQIGQLEPGELVLTMMISDLATVPMADMGIPLLAGVLPILTLLAASFLLSQLSLKSLRFRTLLCGHPALLIEDGQVRQEAMRRNRFTLDELLEQLRIQGISRIEDVKYAVLENSGQVSVLPMAAQKPPTATQLQLAVPEDVTLPSILINDGQVLDRSLRLMGKDRLWLVRELHRQGCRGPEQVFLMTLDQQGVVFCIRKEGKP